MDLINVDKEISSNNEENTIEKEVEGEDITLKPQKNNKPNPGLRKKGYKKQYDYIKRILPHNKEASLCKKSARKTIPKYLDEEKFAL